ENVRTTVDVYGATVSSAEITQPGSVDASVAVNGNSVTLTIPGPIPGGATITTPQITITSMVSADAGASARLSPGSPFYAVTANTGLVGAVNVTCEPSDAQQAANATLTIPVGAPDSEPPSVTFIEPNESSVYAFGEEIGASYTCSDASMPVT